jgi:hypothetical protein
VSVYYDWIRRKDGVGHLTLFCCRELARHRAPSSPIVFDSRSSVVSV